MNIITACGLIAAFVAGMFAGKVIWGHKPLHLAASVAKPGPPTPPNTIDADELRDREKNWPAPDPADFLSAKRSPEPPPPPPAPETKAERLLRTAAESEEVRTRALPILELARQLREQDPIEPKGASEFRRLWSALRQRGARERIAAMVNEIEPHLVGRIMRAAKAGTP